MTADTPPPQCGDWLHTLPISASLCLRLDDETIRVAVGLRNGISICIMHPSYVALWPAGFDNSGTSLTLRQSSARQYNLNEIIFRARVTANIPAIRWAYVGLKGKGTMA